MKAPVIIPLDGSALAEQAIPLGYSIAQRINAEVLLLQVVPKEIKPTASNSDKVIRLDEQTPSPQAQADSYLQGMVEQLTVEGGAAVSYAIAFGSPGEAIAEVADEREASYIVMSTHGYTGVMRWLLGSVADRVLHLTERPLVLVRPPDMGQYNPAQNIETQLPEIKCIVVPLEGLPLAEQILPHAKEVASAYGGANILLFHAIPPFPAGLVPLQTENLKKQWLDLSHEEAESYLGNLVHQLRAEGNTVQFALRVGIPAQEILDYAAEVDADMIMMTSHVREGLSRFLLGSVAGRVVHAGQLPVMIVRPADTNG
ncbi:MAG: universal stress protein [Ardenticatenaceae bacterium]